MRTRSATRLLLALLTALALGAVACNGDTEGTVDITGTTQPLAPEEDAPEDLPPPAPGEEPDDAPGEVTDAGPATPDEPEADGQADETTATTG